MIDHKKSEYKIIPYNKIDASLHNIRGRQEGLDTIRTSMKEHGFLPEHPLDVILHPTQKGMYLLWHGEGRYTVAGELGIGEVPVIVIHEEDEAVLVLRSLVAQNVRELPPVVLDPDGSIIGGKAYAAITLKQNGYDILQIRRAMGTGDKDASEQSVYALLAMEEEKPEILRRIANGKIPVSTYGRVRRSENKDELLLGDVDRVTTEYVIQATRKEAKAREMKENGSVSPSKRPTVQSTPDGDLHQELSRILEFVSDLKKELLSPDHLFRLAEIAGVLEMILGEGK